MSKTLFYWEKSDMKKYYKYIILSLFIILIFIPTFNCEAKSTGWKSNKKGTWYEYDNGKYYKNCWKLIDGSYYYFKSDGYIAKNEYIQGYYLQSNGKWDNSAKYSWKKVYDKYTDNKEWQYSNGKSTINYGWNKIDNKYYYFIHKYIATNMYVGNNEDGFYWLDKNGVWSYKAKLYQYNYATSKKNQIMYYYKDTKGYIPKNTTLAFHNSYYNELLVTFNDKGYVKMVTDLYDNTKIYYKDPYSYY